MEARPAWKAGGRSATAVRLRQFSQPWLWKVSWPSVARPVSKTGGRDTAAVRIRLLPPHPADEAQHANEIWWFESTRLDC